MADRINLELLLRDMYESMSELSTVLDEEYKALSADDAELLQKTAVAKETLSEKLGQLDTQRKSFLESKGLENDIDGMKQYIQLSSGQDENALYKLWNTISELAQDCSAKNKLTGIIIESKRRQTNAAISILQGYEPDSSELYDADGSSVQINKNSSIARA